MSTRQKIKKNRQNDTVATPSAQLTYGLTVLVSVYVHGVPLMLRHGVWFLGNAMLGYPVPLYTRHRFTLVLLYICFIKILAFTRRTTFYTMPRSVITPYGAFILFYSYAVNILLFVQGLKKPYA